MSKTNATTGNLDAARPKEIGLPEFWFLPGAISFRVGYAEPSPDFQPISYKAS